MLKISEQIGEIITIFGQRKIYKIKVDFLFQME